MALQRVRLHLPFRSALICAAVCLVRHVYNTQALPGIEVALLRGLSFEESSRGPEDLDILDAEFFDNEIILVAYRLCNERKLEQIMLSHFSNLL
jgi:hypothetical protein